MLTSDLLRVRTYRGELRPRYVDAKDPEILALAGRLIEIFRDHEGRPRQELDQELADFLGTGTDFLLHRGLAKLLDDRCDFETAAPTEPEAIRQAVFGAAAKGYRAPHPEDDPHPFHFDRDAVLERAAASLEISSGELQGGLYADLKDEQILTRFDACEAPWLLGRYNVALAQAVLLRASELVIEISGQKPAAYRELFRKIKFFQLMHRVKPRQDGSGDGYEILLDGPMSLFQASGKYGVQMALFLPTLLHFDGWSLEATVRWGKRRLKRSFKLSPDKGLQPINRLRGQWQPEEVAWFPEQFEKLESEWTISTDGALVDLGGEGVLVPDFVFEHRGSGRQVYLEVLGFWRKGAVASRLRLLKRHGPKNLILAVAKKLATGADELEKLPGEIYLFRSAPIARQVLKILDGFAPKKKRRKTKRKTAKKVKTATTS